MPSRFILPLADVGDGISPSDGAQLLFLESGSSIKKDTFSNEAGTTPNPNPVIANGDGVFPEIWIVGRYKVIGKDKNNVQIFEEDPVVEESNIQFETIALMTADTSISAGDFITVEDYATGNNSGVLFFKAVSGAAPTPDGGAQINHDTLNLYFVQNFPDDKISIKAFGAVSDGNVDASLIWEKANAFAFTFFISNGGVAGGTPQSSMPVVWFPQGEYLWENEIDIGSQAALNIAGDKAIIFGSPVNPPPAHGCIKGVGVNTLDITDLNFENFTLCFPISSGNADKSVYNFNRVNVADCITFFDSGTHGISRSTLGNFNQCRFSPGIQQLLRVYWDGLTFNECWFQTDALQREFVRANSNITARGCLFIPGPGPSAHGKTWFFWTDDDGAGGVTSAIVGPKNLILDTCRFSNEGGASTGIVADFAYSTSSPPLSTPNILVQNCYINGFMPGASTFLESNSEHGWVLIKKFPASINFQCTTLERFGDNDAQLIAIEDGILAANENFNINLDPVTYRGLQTNMSDSNGFQMKNMAPFMNQADIFQYPDLRENGYLTVVDSAVSGEQECTFTVRSNFGAVLGGSTQNIMPMIFEVVLGGLNHDTLPNNAYAGSSVYLVSINSSDNASVLTSRTDFTKQHGANWGLTDNSSSDIKSVTFANGSTTTATAASYTIKIIWGTSVGEGIARIRPLLTMNNRITDTPS